MSTHVRTKCKFFTPCAYLYRLNDATGGDPCCPPSSLSVGRTHTDSEQPSLRAPARSRLFTRASLHTLTWHFTEKKRRAKMASSDLFLARVAAIQNNGSSGPGRLYVHRTIITSKNHMFMWKNISICPQDKAYYSYKRTFVSSNYSTSRGDMSAPTTITNCDKSPARYRSISTRQNLNYFSNLEY